MSIRKLLSGLLLFTICGLAIADDIALRPDHPNRYVVVKGDTLWDISARFLETPWRWPEVWSFNPQIKNPHLIYPGDVVSLVYDEFGKPMLKVQRGQATVKMSPKVRSTRIDQPIATIPLNAIQQFLGQPRVVSERDINNSAYIVANTDRRLIAGKGDTIYARGLVGGANKNFIVLRIGDSYHNQDKSDVLGYEALHVADATVTVFGDPTVLTIVNSNRETLIGDRLIPRKDYGLDQTFIPHPPEIKVDGQIISVIDGVSRIGQYQTVVINMGEQDNIETGHVLAIYQSGEKVRDTVSGGRSDEVQLPDIKAGIVLVIRAFERVSYALVMESSRDMRIYDFVRNP